MKEELGKMEEVKKKKVEEKKCDDVFPDAESWAKQERLGEGSTWEQ